MLRGGLTCELVPVEELAAVEELAPVEELAAVDELAVLSSHPPPPGVICNITLHQSCSSINHSAKQQPSI